MSCLVAPLSTAGAQELAGGVISGAVTFAGSDGELLLDGSTTIPSNVISGFRPSDTSRRLPIGCPEAMTPNDRGGTPHVRHKAARVHHAARRRGCRVAARGAHAAASDAGDRVPQ